MNGDTEVWTWALNLYSAYLINMNKHWSDQKKEKFHNFDEQKQARPPGPTFKQQQRQAPLVQQ